MAFSGSQITRLGLAGITRGLYGSFAGKAEAIPEVEAPAAAPPGGVGKKRRRRLPGYPRRIVLGGKVYWAANPEEERRLLEAYLAEQHEEVAEAPVEEKPAIKVQIRRTEKRIEAAETRREAWLRRLMDEDEEILAALVH